MTLAALNVGLRLDREAVTEWDESLYATSAAEAVTAGAWVAPTFHGEVDYYNSKPPLNIWLIGASFKMFGLNLVSLRLPAALSAWLCVLTLYLFARRIFDDATALAASLVLSTAYSFLYLHAGRSGNPDALFALLVLLTVVTLWAARDRAWRLVWLGPIAAAAFLLKGMAVMMPLAIVGIWLLVPGVSSRRQSAKALAVAACVSAVPVGAWALARWLVDGDRFFARVISYDFVGSITTPLEGHASGFLYYLDILQKDHYDWLVAAVLSLMIVPRAWRRLRRPFNDLNLEGIGLLMSAWIVATLVVPTVMQTKLPWYLNSFYPVFALLTGHALVSAYRASEGDEWRRHTVVALSVAALLVAEGKLIWYSLNQRDVQNYAQGLLLTERDRLVNRVVYRDRWNYADRFVLVHLVGAYPGVVGADGRPERSKPGDCVLSRPMAEAGDFSLVRQMPDWALYCRPH